MLRTFKISSLHEELQDKVMPEPMSGCWIWIGSIDGNGYGQIQTRNRRYPRAAHRYTYQTLMGEIPHGLQIDHLCRNRQCVNPAHLEPVTFLENVRRGDAGKYQSRRTHCPHGHEYSGDNLVISKGKNGRTHRQCYECMRRVWRRIQNYKGLPLPGDRTHCPQGHPYSGDNLFRRIRNNGQPSRECRECNRIRSRNNIKKRKAIAS